MESNGADTVVILSSELIAKITEEYFNKTMFKQRVEIVDLKPTENGYMFSVVFAEKKSYQPSKVDVLQKMVHNGEMVAPYQEPVLERNKKGQFVKAERVKNISFPEG